MNKLSNEGENNHFGMPTNEIDTTITAKENDISTGETNEKEVTNEHENVQNENVETNPNTTNEVKMKAKDESGISKNENNANLDLDDKAKSESYSEISSESNEETSYPSSKEQIIRQHKFYIHSAWLAVQSSYFRSLFFSGMKESSTKEVHVQISTSEEQAHLMLLEAIYKIDTLDKASVDELLEVLRIADKYDLKFVFKKCKCCLRAMVDTLEICEQIMHFIKIDNTIPDVQDLVRKLQSFLAKEFSPLDKTWQTTSFKELCEPSLKYLLSSNELMTASENTVFHALMYWIEEHGIENVLENQELPSLLSVVRFEFIPVDYLYNIVQHNSVAKKLSDFSDHYLRGITYHALSEDMKDRLPDQPMKRRRDTRPFVPYTWVISTHKLGGTALHEMLISEEFWYCGYKVELVISDIVKVKNLQENHSMFKAKLSLKILNLTEQSEVSIQWQPTSQCFISTVEEQTHTFNEDDPLACVDIKYKIKVQPKEMTSTGSTPFQSSTAPTKSSTTVFGTWTNSTFSGVPAWSSPIFVTPATVLSKPKSSFAPSTNTVEASKSDPASEQESPNSSCVYIDVKMKLV